MRLYQEKKIVPLLASADITAGVDSDSIDMKDCKHVAFLIVFGPSYAGANGAIIKLYEGASHGSKATALTFHYTYGGAAIKSASADVMAAEATSAALQIARATMVSRILVLELDAAEMTDGMTHLTVEVGAESDAGEMTIVGIMDMTQLNSSGDTVID
jgi:hypothetical protein